MGNIFARSVVYLNIHYKTITYVHAHRKLNEDVTRVPLWLVRASRTNLNVIFQYNEKKKKKKNEEKSIKAPPLVICIFKYQTRPSRPTYTVENPRRENGTACIFLFF